MIQIGRRNTLRAIEGAPDPSAGPITLSVGVALATASDDTEDHAVKLADDRLYAAKQSGRNRVVAQAPENS